jgi:hypothetical protein
MSRRVLTLVEGQTEERFVKDVLTPQLSARGLLFEKPTVVMTKRVLRGGKFRGGVSGFGKFKNDLQRLLHGAGGAIVTTIIDYYRLPKDFPGMATRPQGTPIARVEHVEKAMHEHFGSLPNLVPYLSLHEFEALLFADTSQLPRSLVEPATEQKLAEVRNQHLTPEDINERPGYAPSERILEIFPGYRKTLHGPPTVKRIGLERLRAECQHFNSWLARLEKLAE